MQAGPEKNGKSTQKGLHNPNMKIAVLFPGIGYHCDKPLLYYAGKLARQRGFDEVIRVSYTYAGGNIRGDAAAFASAFNALYEQTAKQLGTVEWEQYDEVLFVSKSIGTAVAAAYAGRRDLKVRHILYTPLKETYEVFERECPDSAPNGIAFIGTADPWSDTGLVEKQSRRSAIPITVIRDGNHSLETGDVGRDLDILRKVMEETAAFMEGI